MLRYRSYNMFCNTFSKDFQTFIEAGLLHYIACCITFCYATSQPYILHDTKIYVI